MVTRIQTPAGWHWRPKDRSVDAAAASSLEIIDGRIVRIIERLAYDELPGWWTDAGTFDLLKLANEPIQALRKTKFAA